MGRSKPKIPYYVPARLRDEEGLMRRMRTLAASGRYTDDRFVGEFCERVSERTGYEYVVPTGAGTHAIMLLAKWFRGMYDTLVSPMFTWRSTWGPFAWLGYKIRFVDIGQRTWLPWFGPLAANELPAPVDTFGSVYPIYDDEEFTWVDSAQSFGATWDSLDPHRIVSLSGSKILTSGEGGLLLTQDKQLYDFAKSAGRWFSRMNEMEAALGLAYLDQLDEDLRLKARIAREYRARFPRLKWQVVPQDSNYYINSALVPKREEFVRKNPSLEFRRYYEPVVTEAGDEKERTRYPAYLQNSRYVASRILAFPSWPDLPLSAIRGMRD